MMDTPTTDLAKQILGSDPQLQDEDRAALWNVFHKSKSPAELAQILVPSSVPDDTKRRLVQAKQQLMPPPSDNPVADATSKMAALPPDQLELAEKHPAVLKAFLAAEEKAREPKDDTETPKAPLTPRPDGQPHFPSIPDGHYRVLASDGGIHDIPQQNIDTARGIDPLLHVLNA